MAKERRGPIYRSRGMVLLVKIKKEPEKENIGEREIEFPKDLCAISENCRGSSVRQNFPSIQNSNEEMPKTKVEEFFELYNIALGLKFKNSKLMFLHTNFWNKSRI
jgi:hypothetical protein